MADRVIHGEMERANRNRFTAAFAFSRTSAPLARLNRARDTVLSLVATAMSAKRASCAADPSALAGVSNIQKGLLGRG